MKNQGVQSYLEIARRGRSSSKVTAPQVQTSKAETCEKSEKSEKRVPDLLQVGDSFIQSFSGSTGKVVRVFGDEILVRFDDDGHEETRIRGIFELQVGKWVLASGVPNDEQLEQQKRLWLQKNGHTTHTGENDGNDSNARRRRGEGLK